MREEPVVFIRSGSDFVPYTPRRKENLHENLSGLEKGLTVEALELTIRKEVGSVHFHVNSFWTVTKNLFRDILTPDFYLIDVVHVQRALWL